MVTYRKWSVSFDLSSLQRFKFKVLTENMMIKLSPPYGTQKADWSNHMLLIHTFRHQDIKNQCPSICGLDFEHKCTLHTCMHARVFPPDHYPNPCFATLSIKLRLHFFRNLTSLSELVLLDHHTDFEEPEKSSAFTTL